MSESANKVATYDDLFNIPDNVVGKIFGVELVTHPRRGPKHARAASAAGALLFGRFDHKRSGGGEGWWILDEPECHLTSDIVVPDISGWRKSTMPDLPETAWFDIRPDWVCEVISPSTAKFDRGIKREIYAREEVGHYWMIDPIAKMIEVFELKEGSWVLADAASDDQVMHLPCL